MCQIKSGLLSHTKIHTIPAQRYLALTVEYTFLLVGETGTCAVLCRTYVPHRKAQPESNCGPSSCEATVLTADPPCCSHILCGSVCECVSDSRLCLVDGAIQSRRHAPQKYRLVMSALFQGVCDGMPGALFPPSFSLYISCTTNSHKASSSN